LAERHHIHLAGISIDEFVSTIVLVPEGKRMKMRRFAVRPDFRHVGFGSETLAWCEDYARQHGVEVMYCHARESAVRFYSRRGYSEVGDFFEEDGIPHIKMEKVL
jgi:predicted GNAT family N-acyltransferase